MRTPRSPWVLWAGGALVALWTVVAIGVEYVAPYSPNANFLFYLDGEGEALGEDEFRAFLAAKVERERQPVVDEALRRFGVESVEALNPMQSFQLDMQLRSRNLTFDENADLRSFARPVGQPGALDVDGNRHLLGTDGFGRDVLSRLLYASRNVLLYATIATAVAYLLGIVMGLCAGYLAGRLDDGLSFLANVILSFPVVVLYIFVVKLMTGGSSTLRPSALTILFAVIVAATPAIFRIVRGLTMDVKTRDYIAAAETRGEGAWWIMFWEILPNVRGPLIVDFCLRIGYTTIQLGFLAFIGLGLGPQRPDWGQMIAHARDYISQYPFMILIPCIALTSLVLGLNLLADGLRERSLQD